jgi:hypothetical protein
VSEAAGTAIDRYVTDLVETSDWIMPVRAMEALLARGDEAVAPLVALLGEGHGSGEPANEKSDAPVWAAVLLGELHDPSAAPALADAIRRESGPTGVRLAAAEALATMHGAALPALRELAASPAKRDRLWAYYAAGRMHERAAYDFLIAALDADAEMAAAAATALADYGDAAAIEPIHRALVASPPSERPEFEAAIESLHRGEEPSPTAPPTDWRVRYRLNPLFGRCPLVWPVFAEVFIDANIERDVTPALRPLDEILATPPPERERCGCCGGVGWHSMRLPVCPQSAAALPRLLANRLRRRAEDAESDDVFDLLDDIEVELLELAFAEKPSSRRGRERLEDREAELRMLQAVAVWAVEQGAETADDAYTLVRAEGLRAAREHGEPRPPRIAHPQAAQRSAVALVGRNETCPCGSGRKYKKCHGTAGRAEFTQPNP